MKLVTVAEMLAIEREADAQGLTYELMMENAGRGLAEEVISVLGHLKHKGVLGLVGSGNNGGDTLVALSYLAHQGWDTSAYLVLPRQPDDPLVIRFLNAGGKIEAVKDPPQFEEITPLLSKHGIILDGVLGTGIKLPLKEKVAVPLNKINQWITQTDNPPVVVAVDCPSGVDCGTGEAARECIPADLTVTMAAVKIGLLQFPASTLVGELRLVGIGLEDQDLDLPVWDSVKRRAVTREMVQTWIPSRPKDAHKGTFGTALLVAGSLNYTGATLLAGEAAFRIGAGLITLAVPEPIHQAIAGHLPESTWLILPSESGVIEASAAEVILGNLERVTAMMLGPGFGIQEPTSQFMQRLFDTSLHMSSGIQSFPPLVIDADGLKLLPTIPNWIRVLPAMSVLTPHPGEMAVLTGLSTQEIQAHRIEIGERYSKEWGHIVVLKGAHTVVSAPDGRTTIIPVATPALSRAGTGDVLSGMITGLLAQGVDPFNAAVTGSWIHAQAGLYAADTFGSTATVLARDVLAEIISVMAEIEGTKKR